MDPRSPGPARRGSGVHSHPIPIPDLPESGIQLSTIEYCKGVEFRLPQCLTVRLIRTSTLIKVYESIISSGTAGTEYCRFKLPWLALSVMSGHTSRSNLNAASEGCHSIQVAQLIMSDLQTSMGDDILQMIV